MSKLSTTHAKPEKKPEYKRFLSSIFIVFIYLNRLSHLVNEEKTKQIKNSLSAVRLSSKPTLEKHGRTNVKPNRTWSPKVVEPHPGTAQWTPPAPGSGLSVSATRGCAP